MTAVRTLQPVRFSAVSVIRVTLHHLLRATAGGRASGSPQRLVRCRFALADSPVTAMTGLARPPAAPPLLPTSKCRSRATAAGSLVAMSVLGPQRTPECICVKRLHTHTHTQTRPARLLLALRLERLLDVRGDIGLYACMHLETGHATGTCAHAANLACRTRHQRTRARTRTRARADERRSACSRLTVRKTGTTARTHTQTRTHRRVVTAEAVSYTHLTLPTKA